MECLQKMFKFTRENWDLIETIGGIIISAIGIMWGVPKMIFKWKVSRAKKKIISHIEDRARVLLSSEIGLPCRALASKTGHSPEIIGQALKGLHDDGYILRDDEGEYFYAK